MLDAWLSVREELLAFRPEIVLVSAGFDAHHRDPLGGLNMTAAGFEAVTDLLIAVAEETADGRCGVFLEGGYDLEALAESTDRCVARLMESV